MKKKYSKTMNKISILSMLFVFFATQINAQDVYVDQNATGTTKDGTSWANAFEKITEGIASASTDGTIHIAKGTYLGDAASTAFTVNKSLTIIGGYPTGGGTADHIGNETILDGQNARRVVNITKGSTLKGLIIENGKEVDFDGAGLRVASSSTLEDCIIRNNVCERASGTEALGGGIYAAFNLVLVNCKVMNNTASSSSTEANEVKGGGVFVKGTFKATNCLFLNNSSSSTSGSAFGGAVYGSKQTEFYNSLLTKNSAASSATATGGGLYASGTTGSNSKAIRLRNSIMLENTSSTDGGSSFSSDEYSINGPSVGFFTAINSLIDGEYLNVEGSGSSDNIDDSQGDFDPKFTDAANNDFTLQDTSGLVNAGADSFNDVIPTDLAGNTRIFSKIDIGPYENQNVTLSVDTTILERLAFYPNPTSDIITISGNTVTGNFVIYSILGKSVKQGKIENNTITVSGLNTGNYILKINTENNTISKKILIQN